MPTIVEIEGVGEIEFPDGMSDEQIKSALDANFGPKQKKSLSEVVSSAAIPEILNPKNIEAFRLGLTDVAGGITQKAIEAGNVLGIVSDDAVRSQRENEILRRGAMDRYLAEQEQPGTGVARLAGQVVPWLGLPGGSLRQIATSGAIVGGSAFSPEGGFVETAKGAGKGALASAATYGALKGLGQIGSLRNTPDEKALGIIAKDAKTANLTPDDLADELKRLGPDSTLSDLSDSLQRTARATYTTRGKGADIAKEYLEGRSEVATQRTISDLKKITGKDSNYFDTVKGVLESRKAQSAPLYASADKATVPASEVKALHDKLLEKSTEAEGTQLAGVLKRMAGMLKSGDGFKTNVRQLHIVKGQIRDIVSRAYRSGSGNMAKDVDDMLRTLSNSKGTGILEKASPEYAQANKIFSDETAVVKALESGRKVLSGDADEIADTIKNLSLAEKDAYMQGAVKAIRDKIASGARFNNELIRERMRNVFDSDQAFKEFIGAIEREKTFAATKNFVLGGSQTANKAEDLQEIGREAVGKLVTEGSRSAAFGAIRRVISGNQSIPTRLREPIARMLVTPDGSRKAVEAMRRAKISELKIRTILDEVQKAAAFTTAASATQ